MKAINLIDAKLLEHGVARFRTSPSADKYFIVSTPRIRKSVLEKHLYKAIKKNQKKELKGEIKMRIVGYKVVDTITGNELKSFHDKTQAELFLASVLIAYPNMQPVMVVVTGE